MKEFLEKLIEKLYENVKSSSCPSESCWEHLNKDCDKCDFKKIMISDVIEIVNQLAEEYNNGWIPCSERLPDDFMSMAYLTTVKGHFYPEVKYYCVANHKWYSNERTTKEVKVIAWMPLPVAFQKGE